VINAGYANEAPALAAKHCVFIVTEFFGEKRRHHAAANNGGWQKTKP
jgi:hypothetical protein